MPLLFINESIFTAGTPINSPLRLLIFFLKRNLKKGLIVAHLKVGGLEVESMFDKNIIELEDNKEYIKEAVDIITILYIK